MPMDAPNGTTRERIVDAAIDLFAERGFSASSMRDIAKEVGITPASIYNHFTSKAVLLDVILNEYFAYITQNTVSLESLDAALGEQDTATILSGMFFVFSNERAERYTKILKIILHEQYREPKAGAFVRDVMIRRNEEYVTQVLDRLVAAGRVRPVETEVYAKILVSLALSSSIEALFYEPKVYRTLKRVSRRRAMDTLFKEILLPQGEDGR